MQRITLSLVILSALAVSACAAHRVQFRNPAATPGQVHSERQAFYLWGLAGGEEVDLERLCPQGVAAIATEASVGDQVFTWFTGGLYSPRSVQVTCAGGIAYRIEAPRQGDTSPRVAEIAAGEAPAP